MTSSGAVLIAAWFAGGDTGATAPRNLARSGDTTSATVPSWGSLQHYAPR